MEHLFAEKKISTSTSLVISIRDLNLNDKYEKIQIRIKDKEWIIIPFENSEPTCSTHIYNLQPFTRYTIEARIYKNGNCFDLNPLVVTTQPNHMELGIVKNFNYKNKGVGLNNKHKTPEPIQVIIET